jgi:hypothetical protein
VKCTRGLLRPCGPPKLKRLKQSTISNARLHGLQKSSKSPLLTLPIVLASERIMHLSEKRRLVCSPSFR